jgi:cobalamin biosynthesis protein CobD/CbiB
VHFGAQSARFETLGNRAARLQFYMSFIGARPAVSATESEAARVPVFAGKCAREKYNRLQSLLRAERRK